MSEFRTSRNAPVWATAALAVLGVVLIVVGAVYLADTANALPSFFPGHQAGSAHHHVKHAVAALVLGVASLIGAWITTGKKRLAD